MSSGGGEIYGQRERTESKQKQTHKQTHKHAHAYTGFSGPLHRDSS